MSEPVTQIQFYEAMQKLEDKMQDYHRRQREHLDSRTAAIQATFERHEQEDKAIEKRVTRIEEQRLAESQGIARLSALTSAIVTAVLYGVLGLLKRMAP